MCRWVWIVASVSLLACGCGRLGFDLNDDAVREDGQQQPLGDPVLSWALSFGGSSGDHGHGVAFDSAGRLLTVGHVVGGVDFGNGPLTPHGSDDIYVVSYRDDGTPLWSQLLGSNGPDEGLGVAPDSSDNVIVGGYVTNVAQFGATSLVSAGGDDGYVASFSPDGEVNWARSFGGAADDWVHDVGSGGQRIAAAGFFNGAVDLDGAATTSAGDVDGFLIGYDLDGNVQYRLPFGGATRDVATAVEVDDSGTAYVVGFVEGDGAFAGAPYTAQARDALVAAVSPDGTVGWMALVGGAGDAQIRVVAVGDDGNIYVGGQFTGELDTGAGTVVAADQDLFVASYTATGQLRWMTTAQGPGSEWMQGVAVLGDQVFFTSELFQTLDVGTFRLEATDSQSDVVFARLSAADGGVTMVQQFGAEGSDKPFAMAGRGRSVAITGPFRNTIDFGTGTLDGGASGDVFLAHWRL